jgi:hypothetical protein
MSDEGDGESKYIFRFITWKLVTSLAIYASGDLSRPPLGEVGRT